jgi:hypothetical protein
VGADEPGAAGLARDLLRRYVDACKSCDERGLADCFNAGNADEILLVSRNAKYLSEKRRLAIAAMSAFPQSAADLSGVVSHSTDEFFAVATTAAVGAQIELRGDQATAEIAWGAKPGGEKVRLVLVAGAWRLDTASYFHVGHAVNGAVTRELAEKIQRMTDCIEETRADIVAGKFANMRVAMGSLEARLAAVDTASKGKSADAPPSPASRPSGVTTTTAPAPSEDSQN